MQSDQESKEKEEDGIVLSIEDLPNRVANRTRFGGLYKGLVRFVAEACLDQSVPSLKSIASRFELAAPEQARFLVDHSVLLMRLELAEVLIDHPELGLDQAWIDLLYYVSYWQVDNDIYQAKRK